MRFFIDDNSTSGTPFPQRVRNIARHEYNQRCQSGVKKAYVASVKSRGVVEAVRGEAWLVQSASATSGDMARAPYRALSFASLCESFYTALNEDGDSNGNLMISLTRGLEARVLDHRIPPCISKYLVNLHNRFHSGSSTSFIELIQLVPDAAGTDLGLFSLVS